MRRLVKRDFFFSSSHFKLKILIRLVFSNDTEESVTLTFLGFLEISDHFSQLIKLVFERVGLVLIRLADIFHEVQLVLKVSLLTLDLRLVFFIHFTVAELVNRDHPSKLILKG